MVPLKREFFPDRGRNKKRILFLSRGRETRDETEAPGGEVRPATGGAEHREAGEYQAGPDSEGGGSVD